MAIAFGATAETNRWGSGASSSITVAITVATGASLFVAITTNQAVAPTAVDYNGDAMTSLVSKTDTNSDIWVYGIQNPDVGSFNVNVTLSGSTAFVHARAITYTGLQASQYTGATATNGANSGTAITQNITTQRANSWILDFVSEGSDGATVSADDGQTIRGNTANGLRFIVADQVTTVTDTYDSDYTSSASNAWVMASVELRDAVDPNPPHGAFLLNFI